MHAFCAQLFFLAKLFCYYIPIGTSEAEWVGDNTMQAFRKNLWPYIASFFFLSLLGASIYWWMYQTKVYPDHLIAETVDELACIFETIDATAGIASFEHDHNHIDFLTVKSFLGSEVGPMNLIHPKKWAGPYLHDNPTFQEKLYQVAKAKDGYWLLPGEGVQLPNGNVIGTDIIITPETNVQKLLDVGLLRADNKRLARQIVIGGKAQACAPKKLQVFSPELLDQLQGY